MASNSVSALLADRPNSDKVQLIKELQGPVLTGFGLRAFSWATNFSLIQNILVESNGFNDIFKHSVAPSPLYKPLVAPSNEESNKPETTFDKLPSLLENVSPAHCGEKVATSMDYYNAYMAGTTTPTEVAKKVIEAIKETENMTPKMNFFVSWAEDEILRMAKESTERYAMKKPASVLDGVPVVIKDEMAVLPYPTTGGTAEPVQTPTQDATVVKRLRDAGAMVLGATVMVEIGTGVIGENIHYGWPRNPYNTDHSCSGSSSGSAGSVAAGLCPISIGCDGGGSIRLPAAMCGQVGLKCTFGRVSSKGCITLCPTLGHVGPIGATVQDVAATYQIVAGPDPDDVDTLEQPPVSLQELEDKSALKGKSIGVCWEWFEDCDPDVLEVCKAALKRMAAEAGMNVIEIEIPNLQEVKLAHGIIILSEMKSSMKPVFEQRWSSFAPGTRVLMNLGGAFSAQHYLAAQYVRHEAVQNLKNIFKNCAAIATPTCGYTAYKITPSAEVSGIADIRSNGRIMLFATLANVTGVPGISVPAGYSKDGLPVGLQFMGPWWSETSLLQMAHAVEKTTPRRTPKVFFEPLKH